MNELLIKMKLRKLEKTIEAGVFTPEKDKYFLLATQLELLEKLFHIYTDKLKKNKNDASIQEKIEAVLEAIDLKDSQLQAESEKIRSINEEMDNVDRQNEEKFQEEMDDLKK